jgi:hypothetical protein
LRLFIIPDIYSFININIFCDCPQGWENEYPAGKSVFDTSRERLHPLPLNLEPIYKQNVLIMPKLKPINLSWFVEGGKKNIL